MSLFSFVTFSIPFFFLYGHFLFVSLIESTEAEQQMVSEIRNCSELESPSPEAAKSLLMIVTTKPNEGFTEFSEQVRKHNQEPPFGFSEPDIFKTFVRVRSKVSFFLFIFDLKLSGDVNSSVAISSHDPPPPWTVDMLFIIYSQSVMMTNGLS
jgi:hypothetical protein